MSQQKYLTPTWPKINSLVQLNAGAKIRIAHYPWEHFFVDEDGALGLIISHNCRESWWLDELGILIDGEYYTTARRSASYDEQKYPYFDVEIL